MFDKKERIVIYPYGSEAAPFVRFRELLSNYVITGLVAPMGWGFNNKDASMADRGEAVGLTIKARLEQVFDECDTVLISDYVSKIDINKTIIKNIKISIEHKKNIICCTELDNADIEELEKLSSSQGVYFKYMLEEKDNILENYYNNETTIVDIETPVVMVAGVSENTNKFNIQLALREALIREGYNVCSVGTRRYCELFGVNSFPEFMYSGTLKEENKIAKFNRYIKELEDKDSPDVIVIGVPGGIMPINNIFTNRFGVLAYEVCNAITPDFAICGVLYDEVNSDYFDMLLTSVKYKLGFEIDCFSISNAQFDWLSSKYDLEKRYNYLDNNVVNDQITRHSDNVKPIYNITNHEDKKMLYKYMISTLVEYGESQVIGEGDI